MVLSVIILFVVYVFVNPKRKPTVSETGCKKAIKRQHLLDASFSFKTYQLLASTYNSLFTPSKKTLSWSSTLTGDPPNACSSLAVCSSDASLILISISICVDWFADEVV